MITVDNHLLGTKEKHTLITYHHPLGNPFRVGDQNAVTGTFILDQEGVQRAYHQWLVAQLKLKNPVIIEALDEIAWDVLDGKHVILKCTCRSDHCHGFIIKAFVEEAIQNGKA